MTAPSFRTPVALVTGGSQGIGAASVQRFLDRGWNVSTVSLPGENLKRWCSDRVLVIEGDLTSEQVRRTAVEQTLERFHRIDALVNNAGVGLYATPSTLPPVLLQRLFDVNVVAPLALAQLVIPVMRRQRSGAIVNVGSVAGHVSMPWAAGYCASKFAMHAVSDSLRRELRKDGIRVVKICPGIVATRFRENVLAGSVLTKLEDLRPVVSPERVAATIVRAVESRWHHTMYVPEIGRLFSAVQHFCPPLMDWYLGRLSAEQVVCSTSDHGLAHAVEPGAEK